ncbi:FG-GAP-like repeat-containing protein [Cystobacter fuscus]|uniref:FG-GAP-like repeat-containing protein n=1 Tax=Cystobacter fuscus TaxID=43 RepID=UPI0012FE538F|nr:FG-GAP-like repeat-containing protein [Cystobacter fuscus]
MSLFVAWMVVGTACQSGNGPQPPPPNPPTPLAAPSAPGPVEAVAEVGGATLTWSAPAQEGGSPITGYRVDSEPREATLAVQLEATTARVTGLHAGVTYRFSVAAVNVVGAGPATSSAAVTLPDVPGAPVLLSARRGDAEVEVTWKEPGSDGGRPITGYLVTAHPQGVRVKVEAEARSAVVGGLTNGEPSTFTVRALNAVGEGLDSSASVRVVPATVPSAPTEVEATAAIREATVTWSEPASTGGLPVEEYVVTVEPGGMRLLKGAEARSATVTGLSNGTEYTFTVTARNEVGEGAGASASRQRTLNVPLAPGAVKATGGVRSATVSWEAPAGDGGSAITGYTVEVHPTGTHARVGAETREVTLPELPSTRAYTFTVSATNAVGTSDVSSASSAVRPLPMPVQVTALSVPSSQEGCLSISYTLRQQDGERADVIVEVDAKGDGAFQRVTQAGSTDHEGLLARATSPAGAPHRFLWNRAVDVPGASTARVRVSARVGGTGQDSRTVALSLPAVGPRCEPRMDTGRVSTTRGHPHSGTVGDFDRDGKLDLAIVEQPHGSSLTLLMGLGNGGFQPARQHELGSYLGVNTRPVAADLDGDGSPELIWAGMYPGLSVARGLGNGAFDTVRAYRLGFGSGSENTHQGVAVADFDRDGTPDVAAVASDGTLGLLLNQGDGTLGDFKPLGRMGSSGARLALADLDEDGHQDLLAAGIGAAFAVLSNGEGPFRIQQVQGAFLTHDQALGDFDKDGHVDLITATSQGNTTQLFLFRGDGRGGFSTAERVASLQDDTFYWEHASVAAADLDGDGQLDLAVKVEEDNTLALLRGLGDGTFAPGPRLPAGRMPYFVTTADFDGDGVSDVATLQQSSDDARVWLGGPGRTTQALLTGPGSHFATGDFNGDGWTDAVTSTGPGLDQVGVSLGGPGGLLPRPAVAVGSLVHELLVARVDADAALDVVVVRDSTDGTVGLLLGNGDGTLRPGPDLSPGGQVLHADAGDVNGDGRLDLVFRTLRVEGDSYLNEVRLLLGRGDGTFEPPVVLSAGDSPTRALLGDLDHNGTLDLVVPQGSYGQVTKVLMGRGDGTFTDGATLSLGYDVYLNELRLADLDDDGFLDAVYSGHGVSYSLYVMKGTGTGRFAHVGTYPAEGNCSGLDVVDFDQDGWRDVLCANPGMDSVSLLRGVGQGVLAPAQVFGVYEYAAMELAVLDANGDGLLDLLLGSGLGLSGKTALLLQH